MTSEESCKQEIVNPLIMKLSEMFDYADKNLKHAYWIYGSAKHNLCCANGTVAFILSNGKTTFPYNLKKIDPKLFERYEKLKKEFHDKDRLHFPPNFYNDFFLFSFKRLANKCRSMGL